MYKEDLALNNLQRLICHKTQTTKQPTIHATKYARINTRSPAQVHENDTDNSLITSSFKKMVTGVLVR